MTTPRAPRLPPTATVTGVRAAEPASVGSMVPVVAQEAAAPQSWGYSHPRSQEHIQQGLGGSTVLGSSGGTWAMRGTWEGAGTAAGSAGRTSLQDFDLQQIKETL